MIEGLRARAADWLTPTKAATQQAQQQSAMAALMQNKAAPKRGSAELVSAYRTTPWLRAVAERIATSVSAINWSVEKTTRRPAGGGTKAKAYRNRELQRASFDARQKLATRLRKNAELEPIDEHPLGDLLANGNEMLSGRACMLVTELWLDILGEAVWVLERNGLGMPVAIWPTPPHWMTEQPTSAKPVYTFRFNGQTRLIPEADVLYFRNPDPANPYGRGTGTAESLGDEIDTDEYAAKYIKTFFFNSAIPPAIVSLEGAGDENIKAAEATWQTKYRGHGNAHRISFTNKKLDVKELVSSFQDQQIVELRKSERDIIVQVFGVPPEILGILTNSNRATIDAADLLYAKYVLVPRLERIREVLQNKLAPMFDERLVVDFESPIPEDREFWLKVAMANPAAMTRGEWRERLGLESHGTVDEVYVMQLGQIERQLTGEMPTPWRPMTPGAPGGPPAAEPPDAEEPEDKGMRRRAVTKDDDKRITEADLDALLEALRPERLTLPIDELFKREIEKWGNQKLGELGLAPAFSMLNPLVTEHLEKLSLEHLSGYVHETTKQSIRDTLTEGVQAGEGIRELAGRVKDTFEVADSWRAINIARTEVLRSSNFATFTAYDMSGMVTGKQWVDTPDGRTRDSHVELGAMPPVPLHDAFTIPSSGKAAMHPGDFNDPAEDCMCRCTTVASELDKPKSAAELAAVWKAYDRDLIPWEDDATSALRRGFGRQRDDIIATLQRLAR